MASFRRLSNAVFSKLSTGSTIMVFTMSRSGPSGTASRSWPVKSSRIGVSSKSDSPLVPALSWSVTSVPTASLACASVDWICSEILSATWSITLSTCCFTSVTTDSNALFSVVFALFSCVLNSLSKPFRNSTEPSGRRPATYDEMPLLTVSVSRAPMSIAILALM